MNSYNPYKTAWAALTSEGAIAYYKDRAHEDTAAFVGVLTALFVGSYAIALTLTQRTIEEIDAFVEDSLEGNDEAFDLDAIEVEAVEIVPPALPIMTLSWLQEAIATVHVRRARRAANPWESSIVAKLLTA